MKVIQTADNIGKKEKEREILNIDQSDRGCTRQSDVWNQTQSLLENEGFDGPAAAS